MKEKESISPEVHSVDWIDLDKAIEMMDTSSIPFVNDWQAKEFKIHKIPNRDPMEKSRSVLMEIQTLGTKDAIIQQSKL